MRAALLSVIGVLLLGAAARAQPNNYHGNDTGGIIPWSCENEAMAQQLAAPAGAAGSAASATANAKASNGARPDMISLPATTACPDGDRRTPAKSRWRRAQREESGDCGVKVTLSGFVPRRLCSAPRAV